MPSETLNFNSAFPDFDESDWRQKVEAALKGRAPETLNTKTIDGIGIQALYRSTDANTSDDPEGYIGQAPYVRGRQRDTAEDRAWDIRQVVEATSPEQANKLALEELERGASSVQLNIDPKGRCGTPINDLASMRQALSGIRMDWAPVALEAIRECSFSSIRYAAMLAAIAEEQQLAPSELKLSFNLDPIGDIQRLGALPYSFEDNLSDLCKQASSIQNDYNNSNVLLCDSKPTHEAGGSETQELAYFASGVSAYLKACISNGDDGAKAASMLLSAFSVGSDILIETAKLRAARIMWSQILEAFGIDAIPATIHAFSSSRMLTKRDPWVNILRNSASSFAAVLGGADIVTIRPFTDALGQPEALGRRLARNTQIIAQEESYVGNVQDPAGGAWSVTKLAWDMAENAWAKFQGIEADGGIGQALMSGSFQKEVAEVRSNRDQKIAHRKIMINGVSDFPLLDEQQAPYVPRSPLQENDIGKIAEIDSWEDLLSNTKADSVSLVAMSKAATADILEPMRLSEPFEKLRDRSDAYMEAKGHRPRILLATLGPQSEYTPRVSFARNLFAAGGIEAIVFDGEASELGASLTESNAVLACICGTNQRYESEAADLAKTLKSAGAAKIYLAGAPGKLEDALITAGVDSFVFVGVDALAHLDLALSEIGAN